MEEEILIFILTELKYHSELIVPSDRSCSMVQDMAAVFLLSLIYCLVCDTVSVSKCRAIIQTLHLASLKLPLCYF